MIRQLRDNDIDSVIQIWLQTNIQTHFFIAAEYWIKNCEMVKQAMQKAEVYVFENSVTNQIEGFIGLSHNYIEGLFVKKKAQSKGIGKQLMDYAKGIKKDLRLRVYMKNTQAIRFYQREQFVVQSENIEDNTNEKEIVMIWSR